MAKKKKTKVYLSDQELLKRKLKKLLKRSKQVRCTFVHESHNFGYLPLSERDQRRRLISRNGDCLVSYRSAGYRRFSGYDESCFMDEYYEDGDPYDSSEDSDEYYKEPLFKRTLNRTLTFMTSHDEGIGLKCVLIEYGKRFKKKIKL